MQIIKMNMEEYLERFGLQYEDGELWDYPLEEMEYILENNECTKYALIENRLYEMM